MRINKQVIVLSLLVAWCLVVFNPRLSVADSSSEKSEFEKSCEEIVEGIGSMVLCVAWPTATYKYSSFKGVDFVKEGIDITFRIYGQSAWTDGEIWLDVILTLDSGLDLKNIRWGDYSAFFPPGSAVKALVELSKKMDRDSQLDPLAAKFCGIWVYDDSGHKNYLKVTQEGSDKFKFSCGYIYEGKIVWMTPYISNADGIYLKLVNGKMIGEFVSSNFYATHGMEFTYKITLDIKSKDKLLYSVFSSIRGETDIREATKISD